MDDAATSTAEQRRESRATVTLPRALHVLIAAAAAVVVIAGLRAGAGIVAPVVLAVVLAIAVLPLGRAAARLGWPGWVGTGMAMVAAYGIVLVLFVGFAVSVVQLTATLPQYASEADRLRADTLDRLDSLGVAPGPAATAMDQLDVDKVVDVLEDLLGSVLDVLGSLFFLVTLLFFIVAETATLPARKAALRVTHPRLVEALSGFVRDIQRYLVVTALFGTIVAVLDAGALWLLGIPLPLVWGLLSFVTNFVPNIGFVIGLVPPALLGLLEGGWDLMLAVVAVYCVLNVVIQTFIQPRVVGDVVGLGTAVTFLSLALWTFVLGPLGALLAVPVSLLVRTLLVDADPTLGWVRTLVGQPPPRARTGGDA